MFPLDLLVQEIEGSRRQLWGAEMSLAGPMGSQTFISKADPWDKQRQFLGDPPLVINLEGGFINRDDLPAGSLFFRPKPGTGDRMKFEVIEDLALRLLGPSAKGVSTANLMAKIVERTKYSIDFVEGCLRLLVANATIRATSVKSEFLLELSEGGKKRERQRSFAASFAHELIKQAEQIGNLLSHGPTVGSYREELLRELLQRHIPQRFHAATGFVLGADEQLDIIIYDRIDYAPIFQAGNLVVVPSESVRAVIEVKSSLSPANLRAALRHLDSFRNAPGLNMPPAFVGIFAFSRPGSAKALSTTIVEHYRDEFLDESDLAPSTEKGLVLNAYDLIDAVCVLRSDIITVEYRAIKAEDAKEILSPAVFELENSSEREFHAAWFFGRLSQYLRFPFDGVKTSQGLQSMWGGRTWPKVGYLINGKKRWGPYSDIAAQLGSDHDYDPVARFEAELKSFTTWLQGGAWLAPVSND